MRFNGRSGWEKRFDASMAGATPWTVGFDAGYESSSGFRDAFAAEFGLPPGRARSVKCLVADEIVSPTEADARGRQRAWRVPPRVPGSASDCDRAAGLASAFQDPDRARLERAPGSPSHRAGGVFQRNATAVRRLPRSRAAHRFSGRSGAGCSRSRSGKRSATREWQRRSAGPAPFEPLARPTAGTRWRSSSPAIVSCAATARCAATAAGSGARSGSSSTSVPSQQAEVSGFGIRDSGFADSEAQGSGVHPVMWSVACAPAGLDRSSWTRGLGKLRAGDVRTRLQQQPFAILRMMIERPGDVVTREEFRSRLWPDGTFVDFEHSLNAAVKRLRAALGDAADSPRFVETVPRRGYRFIAPVDRGAVIPCGVIHASGAMEMVCGSPCSVIDAAGETQLWSATCERDARDVLAVHIEVAAHTRADAAVSDPRVFCLRRRDCRSFHRPRRRLAAASWHSRLKGSGA